MLAPRWAPDQRDHPCGPWTYKSTFDIVTGDLSHTYVCDQCGATREFTKEESK